MRWIIGIVVVVVIAILGYQYFGGGRDMNVAEQAGEEAQQAAQEAEKATEEADDEEKASIRPRHEHRGRHSRRNTARRGRPGFNSAAA